MDSNSTHVYYAVNEKYANITAVSAYSYLKYNTGPITIYLVNCNDLDHAQRMFSFDSRIIIKSLKITFKNIKSCDGPWYCCRNELMARYYVLDLIKNRYEFGLNFDADTFFVKRIDFENIIMDGYDAAATFWNDRPKDTVPQLGFTIYRCEHDYNDQIIDSFLLEYDKVYPSTELRVFSNPNFHSPDELLFDRDYKKVKRLDQSTYNSTDCIWHNTIMYHMSGMTKPWNCKIENQPFGTPWFITNRIKAFTYWYRYMHEIEDYLDPEFVKKANCFKNLYRKIFNIYIRK